MEFTVTIKLGNDALQTGQDIADLLNWRVVPLLRGTGEPAEVTHAILDLNGNTVGEWEFRQEEQ